MEIVSYKTSSLLIALFFFLVIVKLIRKGRLHEKYSLMWLVIGLGILAVGAFPQLIDRVAVYLGVGYAPILLVYVGMGLLFVQQLHIFINTSKNETRIKELAQELAVLQTLLEEKDEEKREERQKRSQEEDPSNSG